MGEEVKMEKSVEDMVPNRFHKYLSVLKKKELEHLPLWKLWDHAIKTKLGFQLKKSKVYALSPKEQEKYLFFLLLFSMDGWVFWPLGPVLANGGVEVDEGELNMMILLIMAHWNYTQSD